MSEDVFFIFLAVVSGGGVLYTYVGYPLIMFLYSLIRNRSIQKSPWRGSVSVVLVVRNEESAIRSRIENLLDQSGDWCSYQVIAASDGSTDGTAAQMRSISDKRLVVMESAAHRGKADVLNDAIARSSGEIIVFADGRQRFDRTTVAELCANFSDSMVGAVSGELHFENNEGVRGIGAGLSAYWNLEKMLRKAESRVDSVIGCTGAVYAILKDHFTPLHPDTVLDDVAIPMMIAMSGRRVVFEPTAKAWDRVGRDAGREFKRKIRTLAGSLQLCALYPDLLNLFLNRLIFQFFSHKIMRLFAPWCLIVFFAASAVMGQTHPAGVLLVILQLTFYGLGVAGLLMRSAGSFMLSAPAAFLLLNICAAAAPFYFWRGRVSSRWR